MQISDRRRRFISSVAAAVVLVGVAGCSSDGDGEVNARDQDPGCHRAALASASQQQGFEWNGSGMDRYHREYKSCTRIAG